MKNKITVNHLGYMTGMPKSAVCKVSSGIFYLVDAKKGSGVYAGRLSKSFFDRESGETVRLADFSDFNTPGTYFIRAGYRKSDNFTIAEAPYKDIRGEILHAIYISRCGFDFYTDNIEGRTAGKFAETSCHTDGIMNSGIVRKVTGGWHYMGGYERDTAASCLVTADMLYACKLFEESFEKKERILLNDEIKWGLHWLLSMQDTDGGVFEGVYALKKITNGPRIDDPDDYFLGEKLCSAALKFTAVTALGAGFFKDIDRRFSAELRCAAEKAWLWIVQSSEYCYYSSQSGSFSPDGEGAYPLESEFMWAMCEMYDLTGDESFSEMIGKKYMTSEFTGFGERTTGGFAALSYLLTERQIDRTIEAFVRKKTTDRADRMWIADNESGYRIARSAGGGFGMGSNFGVLCDCMGFITAYLISGEQKYLTGAVDQFSYIFGQNPFGISYITGTLPDRCNNPCHRLSYAYEGDATVPGLIVGGPNTLRSDEYSKWHIEKGAPPAKCYIDNQYSFSTNQPSVHYSAPVIFISAFFDKVGRSALSGLRSNPHSLQQ